MSEQETGRRIHEDDQAAAELRAAIHSGDLGAVRRLLRSDPGLATAHFVARRGGSGTALHHVTDWPGYFPNGPQTVRLLIDAGADPSARHPPVSSGHARTRTDRQAVPPHGQA